MAQVRQELRLRMAGGFRGLLGGTQPLAEPFPFGHVEPQHESAAVVRPVLEDLQDPILQMYENGAVRRPVSGPAAADPSLRVGPRTRTEIAPTRPQQHLP